MTIPNYRTDQTPVDVDHPSHPKKPGLVAREEQSRQAGHNYRVAAASETAGYEDYISKGGARPITEDPNAEAAANIGWKQASIHREHMAEDYQRAKNALKRQRKAAGLPEVDHDST